MTYEELLLNYQTKKDEYTEKEQKLDKLIDRYETLIEKAKEKRKKLWSKSPSYIDLLLKPLAEIIKERINAQSYEIYGPFGLNGETSIYFNLDEKNKAYLRFSNGASQIFTGKTTNEYKPGSLGYYNGFNNIYTDMPKTIDEIMQYLITYKDKEEK